MHNLITHLTERERIFPQAAKISAVRCGIMQLVCGNMHHILRCTIVKYRYASGCACSEKRYFMLHTAGLCGFMRTVCGKLGLDCEYYYL